MKNRMAVRALLVGRLMQLPAEWTDFDGMVHLDCRHFGPLAGFLLREAGTFWKDQQVILILACRIQYTYK